MGHAHCPLQLSPHTWLIIQSSMPPGHHCLLCPMEAFVCFLEFSMHRILWDSWLLSVTVSFLRFACILCDTVGSRLLFKGQLVLPSWAFSQGTVCHPGPSLLNAGLSF